MSFLKLSVLVLIGALFLFASNISAFAKVYVNGYYRKDGTYVRPHYRSSPSRSSYGAVYVPPPSYTPPSTTFYYPTTTPKAQSSISNPINAQGVQSAAYNFYPNTVQFNGLNWVYFDKNSSDAIFVAQRKREYWSGYPVVAIMYLGLKTPQGNLTWQGRKIMKLAINCQSNMIAGIAEAVIDSQGQVVKNEIIVDENVLQWQYLGGLFDIERFKQVANVCNINELPVVENIRG